MFWAELARTATRNSEFMLKVKKSMAWVLELFICKPTVTEVLAEIGPMTGDTNTIEATNTTVINAIQIFFIINPLT